MTVLAAAKTGVTTPLVRPEPVEELPAGWVAVPLGDVIQPVATTDPARNPDVEITYFDISSIHNESGVVVNPKVVRGGDAPSRARQVVEIGDVLFSTVRPNLRAIARVPNAANGVASTGFCVLRAADPISPKYLFYFVRSEGFLDVVLPLQRGVSYPAVRSVDVVSQSVPLAPAAEQNRIVEKLEELLSDLDAGVAELKSAQKKLTQYRQSLLKAAVEGALTTQWRARRNSVRAEPVEVPAAAVLGSTSSPRTGRVDTRDDESGAHLLERILKERRACWQAKQLAKFKEQGKAPPKDWQDKYPEPVKPDTTDLPPLPEGWMWASVDQLAIEQKYGTSAKTNEEADGVPVIRMGNIQDGELDLDNLKYLPINHDEFPALHLQDGDLLFNRTNSPELVGKTAVYRSQITPCSYASYLIGIRFSPNYLPELASSFINSAYGRNWVKSVVTQQVGQANVNGTKLAALAVPVSPFAEQMEIVRMLGDTRRAAFEQSAQIKHALKQSTAQRKNILKAAFSGQLVPRDPNDEPASVLLARIRAERVMLPVKKIGKKSNATSSDARANSAGAKS